MKYIKNATVAASECDTLVRMSPLGAFALVENMVTELMGTLKIDGLTCMREYGAMWVFVKNRIELRRHLKWMEAYTAECYISSCSTAKLLIDTVVKREGEVAIASRLELCAVDLKTRRIRPTATVGLSETDAVEEPEIQMSFSRDLYEPQDIPVRDIIVHSTDIDYCHHMNNIAYIRLLLNRYPVRDLERTPIKAIEVQYLNQIYEGERLQIENCGNHHYMIRNKQKVAVHCKFELEENKSERVQ